MTAHHLTCLLCSGCWK